MLEPLEAGEADVVFGSRFLSGRPHRVLYFWHSLGNRLLTLLSNMFTDLNLTDMETCYKAFRREVLEHDRRSRRTASGSSPSSPPRSPAAAGVIYEVGIAYAGRTYAEGKKIGWRDGDAGARVHRALLRGRSAAALVGVGTTGQARRAHVRPVTMSRRPQRVTSSIDSATIRPDIFDDPSLTVGEHDRRLDDPVAGAHEAADELGQERVALGVGRGRVDRPQRARRGRPGSRTCSRARAGRGRTTCTGCPTATAARRWSGQSTVAPPGT